MKNLFLLLIAIIISTKIVYGNQSICGPNEYAVQQCQTVYINGKPVRECRWVCKPLSRAGKWPN